MSTQKWKLVVTALGGPDILHEVEVEANNWMGALRSGREGLGERASMPPGASCSIDAHGTATVLDPQGRRKFVLAPVHGAGAHPAPVTGPSPSARPSKGKRRFETVAFIPEQPPVPQAEPTVPTRKKQKFQTMAYIPGMELPGVPSSAAANVPAVTAPASQPQAAHAPEPEARPEAGAPHTGPEEPPPQPELASAELAATDPPPAQSPQVGKKKRMATVGFADGMTAAVAAGLAPPSRAAEPVARAASEPAPAQTRFDPEPAANPQQATPSPVPTHASDAPSISGAPAARDLELLLERNDDPSEHNPLCYRERAYLLPEGATVTDAEAALRWRLAAMREELADRPRGILVNLAVFDHRWNEAPERAPLVVLQWRDWRDAVDVDFPAAQLLSANSEPDTSAADERLADTFAALEGLARLHVPVDGLDYIIGVLEQAIPCEATAACLYDINTDELRFVSVTGFGASSVQGTAIPRAAGLIGKAVQEPERSRVFDDVMVEPAFNQSTDSRPGLDARNMLVRAVSRDGQLHGVLHLVNRDGMQSFSADDANLLNYIADRLCEFLQTARAASARPIAH